MDTQIKCTKCQGALTAGDFNLGELRPCPKCGTAVRVEVYPAWFRKISAGQSSEAIMVEGESSCFFHPQKKAVLPCEGCGRFLCSLCDCEFKGKHFCPACLETGKTKGKIKGLENERTLYGNIALSLAVVSVFAYCLAPIAAPIVLYMGVRYWKAPTSLVHSGKTRLAAAMVLALLVLAGWAVYLGNLAIGKRF